MKAVEGTGEVRELREPQGVCKIKGKGGCPKKKKKKRKKTGETEEVSTNKKQKGIDEGIVQPMEDDPAAEEKQKKEEEEKAEKEKLAEINRMFILSPPGQVPTFDNKAEAKEYTPDVILTTWIVPPTAAGLADAKHVLKDISNKMGGFKSTNDVDNWEDKACRIIITSHYGAKMLTLAQNTLFSHNDEATIKLSTFTPLTLSLSANPANNEDVCIWTHCSSVVKLKELKDYFKENHSVDYQYEKFISQRPGSRCLVLKDSDDWEENADNKHFFRPDIYLGLFIIQRLIPDQTAVVWDLSPCPGPSFYQMLGMPYDGQASCWFGAVYNLSTAYNMENGGRNGNFTIKNSGAYIATCKTENTKEVYEKCTIMQHIVGYLLQHHDIIAASFFHDKDELELRDQQEAARTVINIALAAFPSVTKENFQDFTHLMYYQHKPDHAANANFWSTSFSRATLRELN